MKRSTVLIALAAVCVPIIVGLGIYQYRVREVSFDRCGSFIGRQRSACFTQLAQKDAKALGIQAALNKWGRRVARDEGVLSSCHLAWHVVGQAHGVQLRRHNRALPATFARNTCEEGYLHGVFIGYTTQANVRRTDVPRLARFCAGKRVILGTPVNCVHAIGHTLQRSSRSHFSSMIEPGCAVVARVVARSMRGPDQGLRRNDQYSIERQCWRGAFMEHAFAQNKRITFNASVARIRRVCTSIVREDMQSMCFHEMTTWLILVRPGDVERLASACAKVPAAAQHDCAEGFGHGEGTPERCVQLPASLRASCVLGAKSSDPAT